MTNKISVKSTDILGVEQLRIEGNDGGTTKMPLSELAVYVSARYAGPFAGLPTPSVSIKYLTTFITDAPASPAPYGAAAGGGSLTIPVYCDGVIWRNS